MNRAPDFRHGPLWTPEGVRFRLWAPSAQSVHVLLNHKSIAMRKAGEGWHEYTDPQAKNGDRYFFLIDGQTKVPDPASSFQPDGVSGASQLIEPGTFLWRDWQNRPWEEAVIYELHVGSFTPDGTYKGVEKKLNDLANLGVTAIELMPVAAFAGQYGWGYDGVFPFAPHAPYGSPEELKHLIDACHRHGMMIFLDVVYNHFGPAGNLLHEYAKDFFTDAHKTPWGGAINTASRPVRDFYIGNALYWLNEYNFDGLRFDAVHAIYDESAKHILYEIAATIRRQAPHKHLILENDKNQARYLRRDDQNAPIDFTAQWNDDWHHCLHVLLTGESDSYYEDYKDGTLHQLGRCLTQGFCYQGEASRHRAGQPRGEKSDGLPPQAFISFLQNHDQIGNRALGERLESIAPKEKLILATTLLLLGPQPPLLFMGQEWGAQTPFLYFCDFEGDLAARVREGRRNEFKNFPAFSDPSLRMKIPDPNAENTFRASCLNWPEREELAHRGQLAFVTRLIELRKHYVLPLLQSTYRGSRYQLEKGALKVQWIFGDKLLCMIANFSDAAIENGSPGGATHIWGMTGESIPAWHSAWHIEPCHD